MQIFVLKFCFSAQMRVRTCPHADSRLFKCEQMFYYIHQGCLCRRTHTAPQGDPTGDGIRPQAQTRVHKHLFYFSADHVRNPGAKATGLNKKTEKAKTDQELLLIKNDKNMHLTIGANASGFDLSSVFLFSPLASATGNANRSANKR
jgi:hypothetical protein